MELHNLLKPRSAQVFFTAGLGPMKKCQVLYKTDFKRLSIPAADKTCYHGVFCYLPYSFVYNCASFFSNLSSSCFFVIYMSQQIFNNDSFRYSPLSHYAACFRVLSQCSLSKFSLNVPSQFQALVAMYLLRLAVYSTIPELQLSISLFRSMDISRTLCITRAHYTPLAASLSSTCYTKRFVRFTIFIGISSPSKFSCDPLGLLLFNEQRQKGFYMSWYL